MEEVKKIVEKMIGHNIVTKQTGPSGSSCRSVLMTEFIEYTEEKYLALLLDRATKVHI